MASARQSQGWQIKVRVRPGGSQTHVGGRYDQDILCVRVTSHAQDGAANRAVLGAVAAALGMKRSEIRLVRGNSSRTKLLEVAAPPGEWPRLAAQLSRLLEDD